MYALILSVHIVLPSVVVACRHPQESFGVGNGFPMNEVFITMTNFATIKDRMNGKSWIFVKLEKE